MKSGMFDCKTRGWFGTRRRRQPVHVNHAWEGKNNVISKRSSSSYVVVHAWLLIYSSTLHLLNICWWWKWFISKTSNV